MNIFTHLAAIDISSWLNFVTCAGIFLYILSPVAAAHGDDAKSNEET